MENWESSNSRTGRRRAFNSERDAKRRLEGIQKSFLTMEARLDVALRSAQRAPIGIREEYRVTWALFLALEEPSSCSISQHYPFWPLDTYDVVTLCARMLIGGWLH